MRSLLALVLVCATTSVMALPDSTSATKSLVSTEIESSGGFGAVVLKFGQVDGRSGVFFGGRGGWVVNRSIVIGGGGYAWLRSMKQTPGTDLDTGIAFAYGGFEVEYLIAAEEVVHGSIMTLIGAGGISLFERVPGVGGPGSHESLYSHGVFVLEPAANVEVNILPWLRIAGGVGYRFVSGLNFTLGNKTYDASSLSGVFGVATIKFGPYD